MSMIPPGLRSTGEDWKRKLFKEVEELIERYLLNNYGTLISGGKIDGTKLSGGVEGTYLKATGLTGATQASRYVGATASGAPASGTFAVGDYIVDRSGSVWVCTVAGTPGTWTELGAGGALADHDHSGDAGDGGTFDAANLTSGAATDGHVLTADGAGGAAFEAPAAAAAHDHTTGDGSGVLTNDEHDGYMEITEIAEPASPAAGKQRIYLDSSDHKAYRKDSAGSKTALEGAGGGGAPTDAEYIAAAAHASLSAEVVIPGLAGSPDIAGAAGAGTAREFDGSGEGPTWTPSDPATVDTDTTVKSHLWAQTSDGTERFGFWDWSPAGAFDVRCKISYGPLATTDYIGCGLVIASSDNNTRLISWLYQQGNILRHDAYTVTGGSSYTNRGAIISSEGNEWYLRITRDGSNNVSFYWSKDGKTWVFKATVNFAITVAKIGFRTNTGALQMAVDWLRTDV